MKRFRFRLARLERLRDLERREARARLAGAIADATDRERQSQQAEAGFRSSLETQPDTDEALPIEDWHRLVQWRDAQRRILEAARQREAEARVVVEEAADAHRHAFRGHRILERLRERRHRRWLYEADLEERKTLDESHLLRMARERREEEEQR